MRTFVLFALALAGVSAVTDDASAGIFGRKKGGGGGCCPPPTSCCGGSSGGGYGGMYGGMHSRGMYGRSAYGGTMYGAGYSSGTPCCGGSTAYAPGMYGAGMGAGYSTMSTMSGMTNTGNVIQTTDGKYYVRGADGSYYSAPNGVTLTSGYTQPYTNYGYPGNYYTNRGIYQAGYPGNNYWGYPQNGVIQTGGTQLQTMPGITLPGGIGIGPGGVTIPQIMPNK